MAGPDNKAAPRARSVRSLTSGPLPRVTGGGPTRLTRQKKAVYSTIESAKRPLSFDEIKAGAQNGYQNVSERTIFRILREMLDDHQLVKVTLAGQPVLYELTTWEERPYFICTLCNQVFVVEAQVKSMFKRDALPREVTIEGVEIIFRGNCSNCSKGTRKGRKAPPVCG